MKENLIKGALLHDIGKLIMRANLNLPHAVRRPHKKDRL